MEDDDLGSTYLESRQWFKNDYEYTPDDDFGKFCKSGDRDGNAKYNWVAERSRLMGVSDDTPRWIDRKWVPVSKSD
ncbi:hypothetical protein D3C87_1916340 [compost metagenome]